MRRLLRGFLAAKMGITQCKNVKLELSEAELNALVAATKMPRSEVLKWHKGFMMDCPSGRLTKTEFVKIYEQLFPSGRAKRFCELVFNVFDKKNTNTIDFREFLIACSLTSRAGKPKEKLKLSLEMYESLDPSGMLNRDEIQRIVDAVHELYEGVPINKVESNKRVDSIMSEDSGGSSSGGGGGGNGNGSSGGGSCVVSSKPPQQAVPRLMLSRNELIESFARNPHFAAYLTRDVCPSNS